MGYFIIRKAVDGGVSLAQGHEYPDMNSAKDDAKRMIERKGEKFLIVEKQMTIYSEIVVKTDPKENENNP